MKSKETSVCTEVSCFLASKLYIFLSSHSCVVGHVLAVKNRIGTTSRARGTLSTEYDDEIQDCEVYLALNPEKEEGEKEEPNMKKIRMRTGMLKVIIREGEIKKEIEQ